MSLLSVSEAKLLLDIPGSTFDADLQDYCDTADEAIEYHCGPVTNTVVTETVRGCGAIALNTTPVLSLVSVAGDRWGSMLTSGLRVNPATGVIRAKAYRVPIREDYYTVTYNAGRADVPSALKTAARVIVKHLWESRRGDVVRGSEETTQVPELGFAVPNRALELMKPYLLGPSVA